MRVELTQEYLKGILDYNLDTGIFTWKTSVGRVKVGDIAGCVRPNGRVQISLQGKLYLAYRLAWLYVYGRFPDGVIDHIDGNPLNNKILNLRDCSQGENMKNSVKPRNNTSGAKGVTWNEFANRWKAQAWLDGKYYYLGYFDTPEEASAIYEKFSKANHGAFYRDTSK